jgi:hypothetical protein
MSNEKFFNRSGDLVLELSTEEGSYIIESGKEKIHLTLTDITHIAIWAEKERKEHYGIKGYR